MNREKYINLYEVPFEICILSIKCIDVFWLECMYIIMNFILLYQ